MVSTVDLPPLQRGPASFAYNTAGLGGGAVSWTYCAAAAALAKSAAPTDELRDFPACPRHGAGVDVNAKAVVFLGNAARYGADVATEPIGW